MTLADDTLAAIAACSCRRCKGLMVWEPFAFNFGQNPLFGSWRCIACGEFIVYEMLHNRSRHA